MSDRPIWSQITVHSDILALLKVPLILNLIEQKYVRPNPKFSSSASSETCKIELIEWFLQSYSKKAKIIEGHPAANYSVLTS